MAQESDFISLKAATQYCDYSQEYLSLRARQKKLKAVKLGRNWATTREWLREYSKKSEEYKKGVYGNRVSRELAPPTNLPLYAPDADMWEDNRPQEVARQLEFQRKLQFACATLLVILLFAANVSLGQEQMARVLHSSAFETYGAAVGQIMEEYVGWLASLW